MTAETGPSQLLVSAQWLRAISQGFRALDLNAQALLSEAEIRLSELEQTDGRIDLARTLKLWNAAAAASEGSLGLQLGDYLTPLHFPLLAINLMHSQNLIDALMTAERYSSVISEGGRFALSEQDDLMTLTYLPADPSFNRHQIDTVLLLVKRFGEWLYCRSVPPRKVTLGFTVSDADKEDYERAYQCSPEFGAASHSLVYESHWFRQPLPGGEPALESMHQALLEEQLQRVRQPEVMVRVARCLQEAVHLDTDREQIAALLCMSVSTLQRKLSEAGTSFQQLLDTERERRAKQLLSATRVPITEISALLGFADSSAFSKAFRRWQGMSPLQFRQSL